MGWSNMERARREAKHERAVAENRRAAQEETLASEAFRAAETQVRAEFLSVLQNTPHTPEAWKARGGMVLALWQIIQRQAPYLRAGLEEKSQAIRTETLEQFRKGL